MDAGVLEGDIEKVDGLTWREYFVTETCKNGTIETSRKEDSHFCLLSGPW
jgi:hypothetical protein